MTTYVKIIDGVVVQKQPYAEPGFVSAPDGLVCGMPFMETPEEVAAWEAEQAAHVPPVTIPDLAPYQFRAMLTLSGNQDALNAFIAALPEPNKTIAQSKMEYSLTFRRDNDLVMAAQGALGLTEQELDVLWLQASLIL